MPTVDGTRRIAAKLAAAAHSADRQPANCASAETTNRRAGKQGRCLAAGELERRAFAAGLVNVVALYGLRESTSHGASVPDFATVTFTEVNLPRLANPVSLVSM
jgi:hypothetical protein